LLRSLVLEASARYADIQPIGPIAEVTEYELAASATYYLSRRLRLFGSLRRFERQASGFFRSFQQNRAILGARLVF
jgi:hypothetical protein